MQTEQLLQSRFEAQLKAANLRMTRVRRQLFDVLRAAPSPLSIQQMTELIAEAHFVSIYRSVDALQQAQIIKQVPQGFKYRYELSDTFKPHHHHATCEVCGISKELKSAEFETLMKQLATQAGLTPTRHHFELYGQCQNCRRS